MTKEVLKKAVQLEKDISTLREELVALNDTYYEHFVIKGVCSDSVDDYIPTVERELMATIRQWYVDKIEALESELDRL